MWMTWLLEAWRQPWNPVNEADMLELPWQVLKKGVKGLESWVSYNENHNGDMNHIIKELDIWAELIRISLYHISPKFSMHYCEELESIPKKNCTESCILLKTLFLEVGKLPYVFLLVGALRPSNFF